MERPMKKVRVLIAKPGLDGHDRGAKVIAKFLQDSGYEVIYTGLHQSPEQIVSAALQEAVDAIGISVLSGSHNYVFPAVMELLRAKGMEDVIVFGGGTIPEDEIPGLLASGVKALFRPGTPLATVRQFMQDNLE
jgi:methylmalonyl-CoA mutase C-terminal domain/subunit